MLPYELTEQQKIERVHKSNELLRILRQHKKTNFKYIITLDEAWFYIRNESKTMYAICPEDVPPTFSNAIASEKFMITIAFCGNRCFCLKLNPKGVTTNQRVFISDILKPIVKKIHDRGEGPSIEGYHIHFDNAPSHSGSLTTTYLQERHLKKACHPAYSPDLSPCDFWFFGYCKEYIKETEIEDEFDLIEKIRSAFNDVSFEVLQSVFTNWMDRLNTVINTNGEIIKE